MDKSTTMEASLKSRLPAPLLCVTLCQPYQSWWQWCASHCLCTGSTPSALKGTSQGKGRCHVDVKLCIVFVYVTSLCQNSYPVLIFYIVYCIHKGVNLCSCITRGPILCKIHRQPVSELTSNQNSLSIKSFASFTFQKVSTKTQSFGNQPSKGH